MTAAEAVLERLHEVLERPQPVWTWPEAPKVQGPCNRVDLFGFVSCGLHGGEWADCERGGELMADIKVGDKVRWTPDEHDEVVARWGNNTNPEGVLEPGREYEIERVEEHSWHTKVWLVGVDGKPFNSVQFDQPAEPSKP